MLFDTHAHLDDKMLFPDLEGILTRAKEAGVEKITNIGCDWASSLMSLHLAEKYKDMIYAAVGYHPHEAKFWDKEMAEKIFELAKNQKVVAIGEIGLDYHYDFSDKEDQKKAFIEQIYLAKELKKPIVIHDREAHGDIMTIVKKEKAGENGGIFHCYSGSWEMAKECIKDGFMISLAGPVTFSNARNLHHVAKEVPLDLLLVETDSPYLSPHPYRGKTNEPSRVVLTAETIAEIKGISFEKLAEITTDNACRIYGISK